MIFGEKQIILNNLFELFPPSEGMIAQIYGRIGSGKTYCAVRMIFDLLRVGKVVYVNFPINYKGYDERTSRIRLFMGIVFPWVHRYLKFPASNLRFFEISDDWAIKQGFPNFTAWVHSRTDCWIFADEGHVWVDSYTSTRMPIELRNISLHTRHYNRNLVVITQRPTAIHVTMRANVNVFYKCEKLFQIGGILRFKVTEYQDLTNETVDEGDGKEVSKRYYWGRKKFFEAYNSQYLRGDTPPSQIPEAEYYRLGIIAKVARFLGFHAWVSRHIKRVNEGKKCEKVVENGSVEPQKPSAYLSTLLVSKRVHVKSEL